MVIGIRKSVIRHSKVGSFMIPFSLVFGPLIKGFFSECSKLLAVNDALNKEHRSTSFFVLFDESEREKGERERERRMSNFIIISYMQYSLLLL